MNQSSFTTDKEILFVTFPVDFGNRTLETNLMTMFSNEMKFFRFAADHAENVQKKKITLYESIFYRLKSAISLRKRVRETTRKGGLVIFHNVSPALFSYGVWNSSNAIIVLDWTRSLQSEVFDTKIKKDFIFYLQKRIFNKCYKVFCWTDAVLNNINRVYGIDKSKLYRVPAPYLISNLSIVPRKTPSKPRVVFIGGDWLRKGGDVLLNAWESRLRSKCHLTILTSDKSLKIDGVKIHTNIRYGTVEHKQIFEQNDILILPGRFDAQPQVIGEAAAGGLAVVTTKFALASPEIVLHEKSGYITQSPEESIDFLIELLDNPDKIDDFKKEGYDLMQRKFSIEEIKKQYFKTIEL